MLPAPSSLVWKEFFDMCEAVVCSGVMYGQGGLSRPVWVRRGIRQGCPRSGQLYTLAIEPFLGLLRRRLQGVCWTGMDVVTGIAVSAYADYVSVMVRYDQDMQALET